MPYSKSYLAYPDIKEALERALLGKGIRLYFKDHRAATRFAARANSYRLLDRKESLKLYPEGDTMFGRSPYDVLNIARKENIVTIEPIVLDLTSIEDITE